MAMPHFTLHQPSSLEEALDLMSRHRASMKVLAGGTDLVPKMRAGAIQVEHLISLNRLPGMNRISYLDDDGLVIGCGARLSEVGANAEVRRYYPALAHACSVMATTQIRNMGTVAGNLVNAAPSADTAAPLLAYKASVVLVERGGRRQVPLEKFFEGPGKCAIEHLELLEAIRVPVPLDRSGSCYERLSARSQVDIAGVGVAGFLALDMEGKILAARLALAAVAPTPVRCAECEALLTGHEPSPDLIARAAAAAVRSARPIDDVRATAGYRRAMVHVLAKRVLETCLSQAQGGAR